MPALNHSDPLVQDAVAFSSIHHAFANNISADLNEILPEGFVAHPHVSLGRGWEADVITKEELNLTKDFVPYQPPKASGISKVVFPTSVSVIIDYLRNRTREKIVAAIEIVSPANKDRGPKRQAFLAKCHSYLQENISLTIIDITSSYKEHNLHFELLKALNVKIGNFWESDETPLYCASYRTTVDEENDTVVEYWVEFFKSGDILPTIPLYITEEIAVPLELEKTYMKTCKSLRVFSRLEKFSMVSTFARNQDGVTSPLR
ncbi:DUF4058 family protein [bacterium]|nr:DUF4058 family protein [bacterium]